LPDVTRSTTVSSKGLPIPKFEDAMKTMIRALIAATALTTGAATALAQDAAPTPGASAPVEKHHSKLKGAAVGGVGGAVVGGKKGAMVGAAGGALWQHHKNKKAEKQQMKQMNQR
jgi:hypothetical protein